MCGEEFPIRSGVGESNLIFAQVWTEHKVVPVKQNDELKCKFNLLWGDQTSNLGALKKHWPEALEHAWGDALASHHADDPDAADATDGRLRRCGATPSSLTLKHQLLSFWTLRDGLLNHPVPLSAFTSLSLLMQIRFILRTKQTSVRTTCGWYKMAVSHLLYVFCYKASTHFLIVGNEEKGLGLRRTLGLHLLEAEVTVHHLPDLLNLRNG